MSNFFSTLIERIKEILHPFEAAIVDAFHAAIDLVLRDGGQLLINAALTGVEAAESVGGTGSDKFENAKNAALAILEKEGLQVSINALHIAIETAVATLRAKQNNQLQS